MTKYCNYTIILHKYVLGPRGEFLFATYTLILLPYIFFLYHDSGVLWSHGFHFLLITQNICLITSVVALTLTALTDPGICVPQETTEVHEDFRSEFIVEHINGVRMNRKWCETCKHYRPLRARHCREVDACVKRFCHFCPWTNNAIGLRNHRLFVIFVLSTCLVCWKTFIGIMLVAGYGNKTADTEGFFVELFYPLHRYIVLVYALTIGASLTHLGVYHLKLTSLNMTTAEDVKGDFRNGNPFSLSATENRKAFWLHPLPDSELMRILVITPIPQTLGIQGNAIELSSMRPTE